MAASAAFWTPLPRMLRIHCSYADPEALEIGRRVLRVGGAGSRLRPLLGRPLHLPVEGGDHPVAAGVDLRAVGGRVGAADDGPQLVAHLEDELRGQDPLVARRGEDDRLLHGLVVVLGGVRPGRHDRAGLHELEDAVAPHDDRGVGRDHDGGRAVGQLLLDGVADEVVGGRRLGDPGEDGGLGKGQLGEVRDAPVAAGGGGDPVAVVAVEVVVEVRGDDLPLALLAREGLREADRLDDLPDLPLVGRGEGRVGQEAVADQLLGDRRAAAGVAGDGVHRRRDEAGRVEPGVLPEGLVLDGGGRVDDLARDLVEGDDVAPLAGERCELDLAGPVVDTRLLGQVEVVEDLLGVGEALAVVREGAHGPGEADEAGDEEGGEEEERDGDRDAGDGASSVGGALAGARPATALPPREAGLHGVGHDSIAVMNPRSISPGCCDVRMPPGVTR